MPNLILDTNLLILFMLGSYSPNDIPTSKFTTSYNEEDFDFLKKYLDIQSSIYITPQVLAELSNQAFQIFNGKKQDEFLKKIVDKLSTLNEKYVELRDLLKETELFYKIGFTDLSIFELAKNKNHVVLTDDRKLHGILSSRKLNSLFFTDLRGRAWSL